MSSLDGKKVVVTRAEHQAGELSDKLRASGAIPVDIALIQITDPPDGGYGLKNALDKIGEYDWVVFTSANAVERVLQVSSAAQFNPPQVAAIGDATAERLEAAGIVVDMTPVDAVAECFIDSFLGIAQGKGRVLLPRALVARNVIPDGLRAAGWHVDVVPVYQTVPINLDENQKTEIKNADAITFTSSSAVKSLLFQIGPGDLPPVVACIGPITAETLEDYGVKPTFVAKTHSIDGLIDSIS